MSDLQSSPSRAAGPVRHIGVFLLFRAGYEFNEISKAFGYRNLGHLSSICNRMQSHFAAGNDEYIKIASFARQNGYQYLLDS